MDPEDRVGAVQAPLRLEEPAKAAGSGLGPEASEDSVGSLVERLCRVDVCEVFSPPRVGVQAVKYGLNPGEAMDLTTGWDFNKEEDRDRAERYVGTHKPLIVIGSPPCTPFSLLQNWNPETPESKRKWEDGVNHMRFVMKLYRKQLDAGRAFLHEQPATARSWGLKEVKEMMQEAGVDVMTADQGMYGLKTWGANRHQWVPAKKPIQIMTNSRSIAKELGRRCPGLHAHQPLLDGRAKSAARYPDGLCRAICRGLVKEKMQQTMNLRSVMEVGEGVHRRRVDPEEFHDGDECSVSQWLLYKLSEGKKTGRTVSEALAWDDLTGTVRLLWVSAALLPRYRV